MTGSDTAPKNGNNGQHQPSQPRAEWIARRKAENTNGNFSQMHYARQGVITEEMALRRRTARSSRPNSSATKSPAGA